VVASMPVPFIAPETTKQPLTYATMPPTTAAPYLATTPPTYVYETTQKVIPDTTPKPVYIETTTTKKINEYAGGQNSTKIDNGYSIQTTTGGYETGSNGHANGNLDGGKTASGGLDGQYHETYNETADLNGNGYEEAENNNGVLTNRNAVGDGDGNALPGTGGPSDVINNEWMHSAFPHVPFSPTDVHQNTQQAAGGTALSGLDQAPANQGPGLVWDGHHVVYINNDEHTSMSPWMQHFLATHQHGAGYGGLGVGAGYDDAHLDNYYSALQHNRMHDAVLASLGHMAPQHGHHGHVTRVSDSQRIFPWLPASPGASNAKASAVFTAAAAQQYLQPYMNLANPGAYGGTQHPQHMCGGQPELLVCVATPPYRHIQDADHICQSKCRAGQACGARYCSCTCRRAAYCVHAHSVEAVGAAAWTRPPTQHDTWCTHQCNHGTCPDQVCACQSF